MRRSYGANRQRAVCRRTAARCANCERRLDRAHRCDHQSCTNTIQSGRHARGRIARKARRLQKRGLRSQNRGSRHRSAPGSIVVTQVLSKHAGLQRDTWIKLGFHGVVGYGCTTCVGNSGPTATQHIEKARSNRARSCRRLRRAVGQPQFRGHGFNPLRCVRHYLDEPAARRCLCARRYDRYRSHPSEPARTRATSGEDGVFAKTSGRHRRNLHEVLASSHSIAGTLRCSA